MCQKVHQNGSLLGIRELFDNIWRFFKHKKSPNEVLPIFLYVEYYEEFLERKKSPDPEVPL